MTREWCFRILLRSNFAKFSTKEVAKFVETIEKGLLVDDGPSYIIRELSSEIGLQMMDALFGPSNHWNFNGQVRVSCL